MERSKRVTGPVVKRADVGEKATHRRSLHEQLRPTCLSRRDQLPESYVKKSTIALSLGFFLGVALAPVAMAQSPSQAITEQEAQAIPTDAYICFYSLVTMDVTRRQFTNIAPGKELGKGPMNLVNNVPEYPPAEVLTGKWNPLPVTRVQGIPSLVAQ
jgi:hypothetical protein